MKHWKAREFEHKCMRGRLQSHLLEAETMMSHTCTLRQQEDGVSQPGSRISLCTSNHKEYTRCEVNKANRTNICQKEEERKRKSNTLTVELGSSG